MSLLPILREPHGRWKTQTKLHDPANGVEGNCTQAVIASLLGLELDEVPDFNDLHKDAPHAGFYWNHLETWLLDRGWNFQMFRKESCFDGFYLADGPSPRGVGHFVVMKDGKVFHDPHPSRAGIEHVTHVWVLMPADPATFKLTDEE